MRTPIIRKLKVTLPCGADGDLFRKWSESSACVYLQHLQLLSGCLPQPPQLCPAGREEHELLFVAAHTGGVGGVSMSAEHLACVCAPHVASVVCDAISRWWWKVDGVQVSAAEWVREVFRADLPDPCFETTNVYVPLQAKSTQWKIDMLDSS